MPSFSILHIEYRRNKCNILYYIVFWDNQCYYYIYTLLETISCRVWAYFPEVKYLGLQLWTSNNREHQAFDYYCYAFYKLQITIIPSSHNLAFCYAWLSESYLIRILCFWQYNFQPSIFLISDVFTKSRWADRRQQTQAGLKLIYKYISEGMSIIMN